MKKKATKAESEHMGRVAELGCILCGQPAEVHHIKEDHGSGASMSGGQRKTQNRLAHEWV